MDAPIRIDVQQAREREEALLVCAYDDEDKCRKYHLNGAITLAQLRRVAPSLDKRTEILLYCA